MKLANLVYAALMALSSASADVAKDYVSDVVDLTTGATTDELTSIKEFFESKPLSLIEFFAPWCGHCKNLKPEYEKAATELKSHNVGLAKVDCTQEQELCGEYGIQGFPTLLVFEDGKNTGRYEGARKSNEISKYMIRRAQPVVETLETVQNVKNFQNRDGSDVTVVGIYDKSNDAAASVFEEIAKENRDRLSFGATHDPKAFKEFKIAATEAGVLVRSPDGNVATLKSFNDAEELAKFVLVNSFPAFGELHAETYNSYMQSGIPVLIAFVDKNEDRVLIEKALTSRIPELKGKANVAFLNATMFGAHAQNVNIEEKFPALVVHDIKTNKKYPHSQAEALTAKSIGSYIDAYLAGEIKPSIRSEPVPESQDGPVFELVATEYDSVVLDDSKDVLVEYYAPWCGHCKNLAPTYEELGLAYKDADKVVIAKLNHQFNEVPDEISGYPTIKLYPAGNKKEPITYSGARTLDGLSSFVEENGSHHVKAGKVVAKAGKKTSSKSAGAEDEDDHADL